jgi:hypothetical protein
LETTNNIEHYVKVIHEHPSKTGGKRCTTEPATESKPLVAQKMGFCCNAYRNMQNETENG